MRLLFVADGRSPIARNWIEPFIQAGDEVHLASSYLCEPMAGLASYQMVPVALSGLRSGSGGASGGAAGIRWRTRARHYLGPLTVPFSASKLRSLIRELQPDLVHALRVPFEGMMVAWSDPYAPLAISTWGNDFTLHAGGSPLMRWLTARTMRRADGLHADCQRDLRLAKEWGFSAGNPAVVLPGNGGLAPVFLQSEPPQLPETSEVARLLAEIGPERPVVVNPRGFRAYVRNDTFFQSIPLVRAVHPAVLFVCPTMKDDPVAEGWVDELSIHSHVRLLGRLNPREVAVLLRRAQLMVSPSQHDGTPNSLLEAMASGAVPIAGDLESIREWINPGENGLLIDPEDPADLAQAVSRGLSRDQWRQQAEVQNRSLIQKRASREVVYREARNFYERMQQHTAML